MIEKEFNKVYLVPRYENKEASIYIYITSENSTQAGYVIVKHLGSYEILNLISDLCEVSKELQRERPTTNGH